MPKFIKLTDIDLGAIWINAELILEIAERGVCTRVGFNFLDEGGVPSSVYVEENPEEIIKKINAS